jgi:DNA-binding CsgD family transcriptional regulator
MRNGKDADPSTLWTSYFTSSESVKQFRHTHGEPDIIQIRKTFVCPKCCSRWEKKVLRRINAKDNPKFLNKSNQSWDNTRKCTAKDAFGNKLGLVSLDDPRWQSGEISHTSKGTKTIRKNKRVFNLYEQKFNYIDANAPVIFPNIIVKNKNNAECLAKTSDMQYLIGRVSIYDVRWHSKEIMPTDKDNAWLINFATELNMSIDDFLILQKRISLTDQQRTAFTQHVLLGKSLAEIASIMNISQGSIKTHIFRAKLKIRNFRSQTV